MSEVAQSCLTLCDPMDCSPPGSSVHGILQARILEWVAISKIKKSQSIKITTITEIKSTLEGTNSGITEAEDRISEVEDRMVE